MMRDYPITIIEDDVDLRTVRCRVAELLASAEESVKSARTHLALGNDARALDRIGPLVEAVLQAQRTAEPLGIWVEDKEREAKEAA